VRGKITLVFASLFLCLTFCIESIAQTTNATLSGTVSDSSGALIPGVSVKATNTGTGIVNTTITNEAGAYNFASLQTGSYTITVELTGFQTQTLTNFALGLSQQVRQNFTLTVASVGTTVEVNAAADTILSTTSSSVGSVLPEFQLRELPTGDRNVMELLRGVGGTGPTEGVIDGFFGGNRTSAVNVTRDGFTVGAGRYDQGTFATAYTSSDLVEEVKITTGTVDAEAGRGSGQVQMVTRSGTNQYRGSIFWNNRNSAFDARDWFANFNRTSADWENRNQFGARLGGPIIKNKTFFFFLIDEQRFVRKENFVGTVFTQEARNGIFRFFPGVDSRNAQQTNPTVDLAGNPVRPSPTAVLQSVNVFATNDPQRPGYDPSGYIQKVLLARMPLPNDFTVGDGLNTAGIRFMRRYYGLDVNTGETYDTNNRDQLNVRLDHNFNSANKLSFVTTYEYAFNNTTTGGIEQWPNGYNGAIRKRPQLYSLSFVSTIGNKVNEARWGYRGHDIAQWAPWYVGRERDRGEASTEAGREAFALLPQYKGVPMQVVPSIGPSNVTQGFMNFSAGFGSTRGSWSPLVTWADTLSWIHGAHSFKTGFELRQDGSEGWNDNNFTPYATLGAGGFNAPIDTTNFPQLTANNATQARNLLYTLSGSIDRIQQGFDLTSSTGTLKFLGYQDGVKLKSRHWRANEITTFFKDEWKLSSTLTVNLGLKWEYYGVPYEVNGLAGRPVGGLSAFCGVGCGGLTTVELVGKHSPSPEKKLFNNDWNNFGPAVGFSLSLPSLGGSTVLRGGYGVNYSGNQFSGVMGAGGLDAGGGTLPGLAGISGGNGLSYRPGTDYWNLVNAPVPFLPQFQPLRAVPIDDPRDLTMNIYEPNRRVPYIQNFNLSFQRQIASNTILEVAYAASKATKLYDRIELNNPKIFETPFLEAFKVTRAGGNHPLFDQMLRGLNIPGAGVVNGTTVTGSSALRRYTSTRTFLANGNVFALADFLNRNTSITGKGGGFIRNGGFPEDFLTFNPQFAGAGVNGNSGSSIYHSLELKVTKRFSSGFSNESTYTWSKTIGSTPSSRDPRNRNLDRAVTSFDRTHVFVSNGAFQLPFGANKRFLNGAPGWVQRIAGDWQIGGLMRLASGAPLTLTSGDDFRTVSQTQSTVHLLGEMPDGKISFRNDGRLPSFWDGLVQTNSANDPNSAIVTTTDTLRNSYSGRAILDASGNVLIVNPQPGEVGSVGLRTLRGPSRFELDMNMVKRVRIDETRQLEFRADVVNILNHPVFDNPNVNINSASFGLISGTSSPPRRFTIGARLNF
jgi:hypothetical protein